MSIGTLSRELAEKGRNGDDMLVHMSREEVAGLQALAKASGKSLTRNPETGLPEAFSLKSLVPALAGAAMTYFSGGAINPMMAGGILGAGRAAMGGNPSEILLTGLGGYGGAGLTEGLAASGGESLAQPEAFQQAAQPQAAMAAQPVPMGLDTSLGIPGMEGVDPQLLAQPAPTAGLSAPGQGIELTPTGAGYAHASPAQYQEAVGAGWGNATADTGAAGKYLAANKTEGLASIAPALMATGEPQKRDKIKMGRQDYEFDPDKRDVTPEDSREYKHFGNVFTKGAYHDLTAAQGGIMRLAAGGPTASTTGGYKPEQTYGPGQSGAYKPPAAGGTYSPTSTYGPGAAQGAPAAPSTASVPQPAAATQKFMFDPATGGFSINPAWQTAEDARVKAEADAAANPVYAQGGPVAHGGNGISDLGSYSDGGRLLRGPGDGVSDSIPAHIDGKRPARLADGEFVVPARAVSELGNGSTEAGSKKLYGMLDRIQKARSKTTGKNGIAKKTNPDKLLPA